MNIAIIGHGKMGKAIEETALQRGHRIVLSISSANLKDFTPANLVKADVAIEFTNPHAAFGNIKLLLQSGTPTICGSTGWYDHINEVKELVLETDGSFLAASNFSIGVNLFFEVNKCLARLMAKHPEYDVALEEIHHTAKKDAPSGTAITLAEQVLENISRKKQWVTLPSNDPADLFIASKRIDPAPGTHIIRYTSEIDDIEIVHTAHSRKGFALGAVLAAEYIYDKKGIFTMKEVLGI